MNHSRATIRKDFNQRRYKQTLLSEILMLRTNCILEFTGSQKRVLDMACGDGTIAEKIAANGNEVYGIDISEAALKIARQRGMIKTFKLDLECDDLPFPADYFDTVVAAEIIEHIFDTDQFLNRIKRILKPQGHLIISTPNLATLGRRLLLLLGKNPLIEVSIAGEAAGHIRYFIKQSLTDLLNQHNFAIDKFTSDLVNFHSSGRLHSVMLAKIFPTIGRTLIVRARNIK